MIYALKYFIIEMSCLQTLNFKACDWDYLFLQYLYYVVRLKETCCGLASTVTRTKLQIHKAASSCVKFKKYIMKLPAQFLVKFECFCCAVKRVNLSMHKL